MVPAVLLLPIYGSLGGLFGSASARSGVTVELQTSGADPELRNFARSCAKATLPPHLLRVHNALNFCGAQRAAARLRLERCDPGLRPEQTAALRQRLRDEGASTRAAAEIEVVLAIEAAAPPRRRPSRAPTR